MWMNGMIYGFCIYVYVLCGFGIVSMYIARTDALNNYIISGYVIREFAMCFWTRH